MRISLHFLVYKLFSIKKKPVCNANIFTPNSILLFHMLLRYRSLYVSIRRRLTALCLRVSDLNHFLLSAEVAYKISDIDCNVSINLFSKKKIVIYFKKWVFYIMSHVALPFGSLTILWISRGFRWHVSLIYEVIHEVLKQFN